MKVRTVLLVEDDPDDEKLAVLALRDVQPVDHLVTVRDGDEALDYLLHRGRYADLKERNRPMVVLLDLKMPKKSGFDVLAEIRSHDETKEIPVVVFTSSDDRNDVQRSYELGANSFVRKPLDYDEYQDTIRQLGSYWLSVNFNPLPVG